ncbi:LigA [Variovorax sp. WDL1]|nr:LigA [Variovorax sp. WDL1]
MLDRGGLAQPLEVEHELRVAVGGLVDGYRLAVLADGHLLRRIGCGRPVGIGAGRRGGGALLLPALAEVLARPGLVKGGVAVRHRRAQAGGVADGVVQAALVADPLAQPVGGRDVPAPLLRRRVEDRIQVEPRAGRVAQAEAQDPHPEERAPHRRVRRRQLPRAAIEHFLRARVLRIDAQGFRSQLDAVAIGLGNAAQRAAGAGRVPLHGVERNALQHLERLGAALPLRGQRPDGFLVAQPVGVRHVAQYAPAEGAGVLGAAPHVGRGRQQGRGVHIRRVVLQGLQGLGVLAAQRGRHAPQPAACAADPASAEFLCAALQRLQRVDVGGVARQRVEGFAIALAVPDATARGMPAVELVLELEQRGLAPGGVGNVLDQREAVLVLRVEVLQQSDLRALAQAGDAAAVEEGIERIAQEEVARTHVGRQRHAGRRQPERAAAPAHRRIEGGAGADHVARRLDEDGSLLARREDFLVRLHGAARIDELLAGLRRMGRIPVGDADRMHAAIGTHADDAVDLVVAEAPARNHLGHRRLGSDQAHHADQRAGAVVGLRGGGTRRLEAGVHVRTVEQLEAGIALALVDSCGFLRQHVAPADEVRRTEKRRRIAARPLREAPAQRDVARAVAVRRGRGAEVKRLLDVGVRRRDGARLGLGQRARSGVGGTRPGEVRRPLEQRIHVRLARGEAGRFPGLMLAASSARQHGATPRLQIDDGHGRGLAVGADAHGTDDFVGLRLPPPHEARPPWRGLHAMHPGTAGLGRGGARLLEACIGVAPLRAQRGTAEDDLLRIETRDHEAGLRIRGRGHDPGAHGVPVRRGADRASGLGADAHDRRRPLGGRRVHGPRTERTAVRAHQPHAAVAAQLRLQVAPRRGGASGHLPRRAPLRRLGRDRGRWLACGGRPGSRLRRRRIRHGLGQRQFGIGPAHDHLARPRRGRGGAVVGIADEGPHEAPCRRIDLGPAVDALPRHGAVDGDLALHRDGLAQRAGDGVDSPRAHVMREHVGARARVRVQHVHVGRLALAHPLRVAGQEGLVVRHRLRGADPAPGGVGLHVAAEARTRHCAIRRPRLHAARGAQSFGGLGVQPEQHGAAVLAGVEALGIQVFTQARHLCVDGRIARRLAQLRERVRRGGLSALLPVRRTLAPLDRFVVGRLLAQGLVGMARPPLAAGAGAAVCAVGRSGLGAARERQCDRGHRVDVGGRLGRVVACRSAPGRRHDDAVITGGGHGRARIAPWRRHGDVGAGVGRRSPRLRCAVRGAQRDRRARLRIARRMKRRRRLRGIEALRATAETRPGRVVHPHVPLGEHRRGEAAGIHRQHRELAAALARRELVPVVVQVAGALLEGVGAARIQRPHLLQHAHRQAGEGPRHRRGGLAPGLCALRVALVVGKMPAGQRGVAALLAGFLERGLQRVARAHGLHGGACRGADHRHGRHRQAQVQPVQPRLRAGEGIDVLAMAALLVEALRGGDGAVAGRQQGQRAGRQHHAGRRQRSQ